MNIAIFGNSNMVMLFHFIKRALPEDNFDFYALGGSPTPSHLTQALLNKDRLQGVDIAIIEPVIIDYYAYKDKSDLSVLERQISEFLNILTGYSIAPLLVILPVSADDLKNSANRVSEAWKKTISNFGGGVIDLNSITSRIILHGMQEERSSLWRDSTHHIPPLHRFFSKCIVHCIEKLRSRKIKVRADKGMEQNYYVTNGLEVASDNGLNAVFRESVGGACHANCVPVGRIPIQLNPPSEGLFLYGLLINWGSVDGGKGVTFKFNSGESTTCIRVLYFDSRKWDLMLGFRAFYSIPQEIRSSRIKISIPDIPDNSHLSEGGRLEIAGALWGRVSDVITEIPSRSFSDYGQETLFFCADDFSGDIKSVENDIFEYLQAQ